MKLIILVLNLLISIKATLVIDTPKSEKSVDVLLDRLHAEFTGYCDRVVRSSRNYEQLSLGLRKIADSFRSSNPNQSAVLETQLEWFLDVLEANKETSYSIVKPTIDTIRAQPTTNPKESWKSRVPTLVQYVEDLANWYGFLLSIFDRMSQNDVQARKQTLSFETLKQWPMFKSFAYNDLKVNSTVQSKTSLRDHEQRSLEDVLHVLLKPADGRLLFTSTNTCELKIEGHFVRMSDVLKYAPLCGSRAMTAVYVFTQHTVFIDSSIFKMGSELLLGVVAPHWEVIGSQQLVLTGFAGRRQPQSSTGDGSAGFPGEPGGTFFGIGSNFTNSSALYVFTNGGIGGNGQMGMNGTNGHGDVDPFKVHHRACDKKLYSSSCARHNVNFNVGSIKYKMEQTKCSRSCAVCCPGYKVKFTIVNGPGPTKGCNGGRQGLGGSFSPGSQIVDLTGTSEVTLNNDAGLLGTGGPGGYGGMGAIVNGVYSPDIALKCFGANPIGVKSCRRTHATPGTRGPNAKDGMSNVSGIQLEPRAAKDHAIYPIISKYRLFIARLLLQHETTVNNVDRDFLERASVSSAITKLADLYTLTAEFLALEELRKQHPGSTQWVPFLDILLQSVEAARQTNQSIIADYLIAAILSRKLSIDYQFDRNLVIDIRLFLSEVSTQIDKLASLAHRARMKALKTIYDQDILSKQQQADGFLKKQFTEDLKSVESKIEASIQGLLTEVTSLLDQLNSDRQDYVGKLKKAQIKFGLNIIFKLLKVVSHFVRMAGPMGVAVGSVLDAGVRFGEKFTQPGTGELPNTAIPAVIDTLEAVNLQLEVESEDKIRLLEERFDQLTSVNPKEQQVLSAAKMRLKEIVEKTSKFSVVQEELTATVEKLRRESNLVVSELLNKVQTIILLSRAEDIAAYEHLYQENKRLAKTRSSLAEIKELKQGLREVEAKIKKVATYERFVEDNLSGYLKNLTELMTSIKDGARQSSAITLEISRYNIRKVLQEVRMIINKYTAGFSANEELITCIDMLDSLMRTTINVYDQIQKYCDQKNLGNLIVGINEAGLTGLVSNDARLDAVIRELDHKIVSSMIQNQYARVLQAFQQLVFPFAPLFLPTVQISEIGLDSTKDDEVMQLIISKIKKLQSIINDMQSSVITGYDDQLFSFTFDENQPFFLWSEVEHSQKITELLQGNEVVFKANVANSVANAVKFNDIRLKFVTTNASYQSDLDRQLKLSNVRLTHVGNSQYKCGSRFYTISHQAQAIEMSVATDGIGEPVSSNAVYKKIRAGDILLSPYTLWKIQLVDCFKGLLDLSRYHGKVQLKLVGKGQYTKGSNPICDQSLDQFYKVDQIIVE